MCNISRNCFDAISGKKIPRFETVFFIPVISHLGYKPLRLKALLKALTKLYKSRAYKRQFTVFTTFYHSLSGPRRIKELFSLDIFLDEDGSGKTSNCHPANHSVKDVLKRRACSWLKSSLSAKVDLKVVFN